MKHNDIFAIAMEPLKGYAVQEELPFERWLPSGTGKILVLKRLGPNRLGTSNMGNFPEPKR
jgi:hypothetical protein